MAAGQHQSQVTNYDPKEVSVVVDGGFLTCIGEDGVTCEKDEDVITESVGAQGDVCYTKVANDLGTITVAVQPESPDIQRLDQLANTVKEVAVWVMYRSEKTGGSKCIVKKPGNREYGGEGADREYEIRVLDYTVA